MEKSKEYEALLLKVARLEQEVESHISTRTVLQENEKRLHQIVDNATAVIYLKDLEGRYLMINKYYEFLFQLNPDQVVGKTDFDLFPESCARTCRANDRAVIQKMTPIEFEEQIPHNDGLRTYISIKFPLYNMGGEIYAVCGISTDITERKQVEMLLQKTYAEQDRMIKERTLDLMNANEHLKREIEERKQVKKALRESERKFRNIFENLQDAYFETSLSGQIINASPSGSNFSGYSLDELIGNSVDMLYLNPDDRKDLLKELKKKGKVREYEAVFRKKNGNPYHVSINADISCDENQNPVGLTGTIRDITQQKKMKERLQQASKMESMGLMASGIAHDLNNILSGIVTYPEVLLMHLPEASPLKKSIQIIQDAGKRAAEVVFDLLTITKGAATGKEVSNLNTIITEFLDSPEYQKIMADHPAVHLECELAKDLLNLVCSSSHMKLILLNLILNASEAIAGQGAIVLKTANRFIEKSAREQDNCQSGDYIQLSLSDTGPGIPLRSTKAQANIFSLWMMKRRNVKFSPPCSRSWDTSSTPFQAVRQP